MIYVGLDDLDRVERQLELIIEVHAAFPNVEQLLVGSAIVFQKSRGSVSCFAGCDCLHVRERISTQAR